MRTDLVVVGLLIAVTLAGCSGPMRKDAVPPELTTRAQVPGLAGVRHRPGIDIGALRKDAVAAEHENGRLLLIATTDLDARHSVLWNMTKIAASGAT